MDTVDQEVLSSALQWAESGKRIALVTVCRTWGSAPRPPGAWMVLREDGLIRGSVSGGCIEEDLVKRMKSGEFSAHQPMVVRYGVNGDEAHRFGLPCGGTLEMVLEPQPDLDLLRDLMARVNRGELLQRRIDCQDGSVSLSAAEPDTAHQWNGQTLVSIHGPVLRLLLIGAGQVSGYLAQMAQAVGYRVYVCDPREEYSETWMQDGVEQLQMMPDDAVRTLQPDARTAIVALTHDPKLDDMALLEALQSPAFYVGALGSHANNDKRRQRMKRHFDLSDAEIARLHGPVGLPIGSQTPPEIAVSIIAQMTALKNAMLAQPVIDDETDAFACQVA